MIGANRLIISSTFVIFHGTAFAQLAALIAPPVAHPVSIRSTTLTPQVWRNATGAWGETLISETYRLRGYNEVYEIKSPGGQGIDHLALKIDSSGKVQDVRFGETKTHFGGNANLSNTRNGRQLSREWLAEKLRAMRNSGDTHLRELAHEISRFRKRHGVPIESLAEFNELNTRTGRYIMRNPQSGVPIFSESIDRLLKRVKQRGSTREHKRWATSTLSKWDQVASSRMPRSPTQKNAARSSLLQKSSKSSLARASRTTATQSLRRLARVAGPIGAAVAVAMDSQEILAQIYAFHRGELNRREVVINISRSGGGIIGAGAGAATGAWLGAFAGPAAWITVPAGATIGGLVGYFAGSTISSKVAKSLYSNVDNRVKNEVDQWIGSTTYVELEMTR